MEEKEIAKKFEKELFALVNKSIKEGLEKPDLLRKLEWVLGSCKKS